MSLARTAVRLAALNALKGPNASSGPTIAFNRIYDSRISDFSPETYPDDAKPTVIVLTDEDDGEALSLQNGGPPFKRVVKLVFEFAMVQGFDIPVESGGTAFVPGYPATDAEHEASLDLLEFQIIKRLSYDPDKSCVLFRQITRAWKTNCHRQVLDETGSKIAARVLTLEIEVSDDQVRVHNSAETLPVGFNVLPDPLRRVAIALPNGPAFDICVAIAKALTPLQLPSFDDFRMQALLQDLKKMNFNAEILSGLDVPTIIASKIAGVIDFQHGVTDEVSTSYQKLVLDQSTAISSIVGWPRFGVEAKLIIEVNNGGAFAITAWPTGTIWNGGIAPTVTSGAGKRDVLVLTTPDGGATIFGHVVGQNFS